MRMKEELKKLKAQRRTEIKNLHLTYLRTKRDVKRTVSPDRFIRRHLGMSIAVAALGGLLLAPRLGRRTGKKRQTGPGMGARLTRWLRHVVRKVSPSIAQYIPDLSAREKAAPATPTATEAAEPRKERSLSPAKLVRKLILELATLLVTKLDLPKIISGIMRRRGGEGEDGHRENGHDKPRITVADAGAMHDDTIS